MTGRAYWIEIDNVNTWRKILTTGTFVCKTNVLRQRRGGGRRANPVTNTTHTQQHVWSLTRAKWLVREQNGGMTTARYRSFQWVDGPPRPADRSMTRRTSVTTTTQTSHTATTILDEGDTTAQDESFPRRNAVSSVSNDNNNGNSDFAMQSTKRRTKMITQTKKQQPPNNANKTTIVRSLATIRTSRHSSPPKNKNPSFRPQHRPPDATTGPQRPFHRMVIHPLMQSSTNDGGGPNSTADSNPKRMPPLGAVHDRTSSTTTTISRNIPATK